MERFTRFVFRSIEVTLVVCLALMVTMVFINVILRYAFNSGITVSEEAARMLFVWLTFLGGVLAMKDRSHVGVDILVSRLPVSGKKAFAIISDIAVLICCVIFFTGSVRQTAINLTVRSPVMEVPMAIIYAAGVVSSFMIGTIVLVSLVNVVRGRTAEKDLVSVRSTLDKVD
jgi:TRAP-type C4-dicarboxylate transport system permease small subunit